MLADLSRALRPPLHTNINFLAHSRASFAYRPPSTLDEATLHYGLYRYKQLPTSGRQPSTSHKLIMMPFNQPQLDPFRSRIGQHSAGEVIFLMREPRVEIIFLRPGSTKHGVALLPNNVIRTNYSQLNGQGQKFQVTKFSRKMKVGLHNLNQLVGKVPMRPSNNNPITMSRTLE